jgi:hypothetical protein
MLAAGGSWLTSSTTLSVVTALGTMLAALAAVWALLFAGPRYRLRYGPLKSSTLDDDSWRVLIYLSSRGRRDITRQAFDQDKPVEIDIGVPIRELANVWTSRKTLHTVDHRAEGTRVLVGPGLISRRQDLCFVVVADAKPKRPACKASLIDVRIRRQFLTPGQRATFIFAGSLSLWIIGYVLAIFGFRRHGFTPNQFTVLIIAIAVFIAGVAYGIWSIVLLARYPGAGD